MSAPTVKFELFELRFGRPRQRAGSDCSARCGCAADFEQLTARNLKVDNIAFHEGLLKQEEEGDKLQGMTIDNDRIRKFNEAIGEVLVITPTTFG